jgi:hypothetical protein
MARRLTAEIEELEVAERSEELWNFFNLVV